MFYFYIWSDRVEEVRSWIPSGSCETKVMATRKKKWSRARRNPLTKTSCNVQTGPTCQHLVHLLLKNHDLGFPCVCLLLPFFFSLSGCAKWSCCFFHFKNGQWTFLNDVNASSLGLSCPIVVNLHCRPSPSHLGRCRRIMHRPMLICPSHPPTHPFLLLLLLLRRKPNDASVRTRMKST